MNKGLRITITDYLDKVETFELLNEGRGYAHYEFEKEFLWLIGEGEKIGIPVSEIHRIQITVLQGGNDE